LHREAEKVQRHFQGRVEAFDSIYTGEKSTAGRWLDRALRWDMRERMRLALEACQPLEGRRVLDVGCGTGRFCLPLAFNGAARVVGIDFAGAMIERARDLARQNKLHEICEFLPVEVMDYRPTEPFDYVLAIGLFDYVVEVGPMLTRLRELTRSKAIMTFPRSDTWRAPLRRLRLGMLGCPVYFYTEKRMRDLLEASGFKLQKLTRVGKLFFVEAT
jgi:2-polyprenyl-3-methyl-5-hydroxy-6-metoxy-1,4-benzoquinol methylase